MLDGFTALFTWPLVTIYLQLMPEVARFAVSLAKVLQRRAAKLLKLSPTTLNEMVHRLGLSEDDGE